MAIGTEIKNLIVQSLAGKTGKEARAIINDLARSLNVSAQTIYRHTEAVRFTGRAARKDIGVRRIEVASEALEWTQRLTVNYDIQAPMALDLARINGQIPAMSSGTYNRWLRDDRMSRERLRKDVRPVHRFEASEPNQIHQFDTTKLEQLHYDKDADMLSWDPRANRKNSRGEKPDSIWLYALIDDHSRCKFALLYRSLNQYNHLDFLFRAWSEKADPTEYPFYGVPKHIYMDNGGGNQGTKFKVALKKLGVHAIPTDPSYDTPHAARKRGKIEGGFRAYNEWLKTFQIRPMSWAEACESLYQFNLGQNRRVHSTTGVAPFQRWLSIKTPQHAPSEDLWKLLHYDHTQRKVEKDLTISLDRHLYKLPERRPFIDWIDEKIDVYFLPGDYSKVYAVYRAVEIELALNTAEIVWPAFHYNRPEREATAVEAARERLAPADNSAIKLFATDTPHPAYLPKRGAGFDDARIAEKKVESGDESGWRPSFAPERFLSYMTAAIELQAEGFFATPITDAEKSWLRALMAGGETIAETKLRAAVTAARAADESEQLSGSGE